MKKMMILWALVASTANAGVVLTFESRIGEDAGENMVMSVEGLRIRMDLPADDRGEAGTMIFQGDRDRLLAVDDAEKSYIQIDQESVDGIGDQIGGAMEQAMAAMKEQLENLPPEQRAAVEKMMKQQMPQLSQAAPVTAAKPEVRRTSSNDRVAGINCVDHEIWIDGEREQVLCVARWSDVPAAREAEKAMKALADFYDGVMASFQKSIGGQFPMPSNPFSELDELGGFPVRARHYEGNELTSESVLQSISSQQIDAAVLDVPADYRRTQMGF